MFKLTGILACGALAILAGCTTAPRQGARTIPAEWSRPLSEVPTPVTPPVVAEPTPETNAANTAPTAPEMKWISLNRWCEEHQLGSLHRLSVKPVESFALFTTRGELIVTVGSRTAFWDGLDFRLGFAPQMINDELFVHALDVQKNIEPVLRGFTIPAEVDRTIVIDPGHGGANTGTRSVADGRWEKDFTLDWALRLAPLLEEIGWRVFLTRTNDVDISLAERVAFTERQHADLFVSLHFNSAGNGAHDAAGLETYCLTPTGMPSNLTRGYPDDPSLVFANNAHDEENLEFAMRLHRAVLAVNGGMDRGVRRARFLGVLRGQDCPAVLLEGGYLSNPVEARRIADPAYRQKLAEAVAKALE